MNDFPHLVPAGAVIVSPPGESGVPDAQLLPHAPEPDDLGPGGAGQGGGVTVLGRRLVVTRVDINMTRVSSK